MGCVFYVKQDTCIYCLNLTKFFSVQAESRPLGRSRILLLTTCFLVKPRDFLLGAIKKGLRVDTCCVLVSPLLEVTPIAVETGQRFWTESKESKDNLN